MSSTGLVALNLGLHGAACGLFALIAGLLWRDRGGSGARRLSAAFAACAAAHALLSAPGVQPGSTAWYLPLRVLSWGSPAIFWLWAMAAFDDDFVLRRWHAGPWAALILIGSFAAYGGSVWPAGPPISAAVFSVIALVLGVLAATQTLATWRADLVAGRRRLRLAVLAGTVAYSVVDTVQGLVPTPAAGGVPIGNLGEALGLYVLAAVAAWGLLRIAGGNAPDSALPPAAAAKPADAGKAADSALVRRLEHLMATDRVYRQEGLTIGSLAVRLGVPEYRLRQAINEGLGYRNFNVFLNRYRVDEAKAALADPSQKEVPVLTIAMDAGFQSLGPFNRAFKAATGMTPTEYRRAGPRAM